MQFTGVMCIYPMMSLSSPMSANFVELFSEVADSHSVFGNVIEVTIAQHPINGIILRGKIIVLRADILCKNTQNLIVSAKTIDSTNNRKSLDIYLFHFNQAWTTISVPKILTSSFILECLNKHAQNTINVVCTIVWTIKKCWNLCLQICFINSIPEASQAEVKQHCG